ncbi:hypothetical protein NMG60_11029452 [Bertholletia excelsa]
MVHIERKHEGIFPRLRLSYVFQELLLTKDMVMISILGWKHPNIRTLEGFFNCGSFTSN